MLHVVKERPQPADIFSAIAGWPLRNCGPLYEKRAIRVFRRKLRMGHAYSVLKDQGKVPVTAPEMCEELQGAYTMRECHEWLCTEEAQRYITAMLRDPAVYQRGIAWLREQGSEEMR